MHYLVWGYYGFNNLGDDLMLEVIASRIKEHDPRAVVSVRCLEAPNARGIEPFPVERMLAGRSPLMLVPYMLHIIQKLGQIDALVIGGGTLFLDKGRHNASMLVLALICRAARLLGKRIVIIGAGIDTLALAVNRTYLTWILSACRSACFRDDHSYEIARSLGTRTPIHRSADILFDPSFVRRFDTSFPGERNTIVLSFSDHFRTWRSPDRRAQLASRIQSLLVAILERFPGKKIVLCAFQQRYGEQDLEYLHSILSDFLRDHPASSERIELRIPCSDMDIQELFSSAAFVIAMRFHALVLSALFGRPFLGIDIETKIAEVCKDFSMPSVTINDFIVHGIDAHLLQQLSGMSISEQTLRESSDRAAQNFTWMDA